MQYMGKFLGRFVCFYLFQMKACGTITGCAMDKDEISVMFLPYYCLFFYLRHVIFSVAIVLDFI